MPKHVAVKLSTNQIQKHNCQVSASRVPLICPGKKDSKIKNWELIVFQLLSLFWKDNCFPYLPFHECILLILVLTPSQYSFCCIIFTCNANCSKWGRQVRTNCRCILACWGLDNSDWSSDGSLTHNHRPAVTHTDILKNKMQEHKNGKLYYNLEYTCF
jgi:hypothetical protein